MTFSPPPYPYARLDHLRQIASAHDGGAVDCSIGTPTDAPPEFVMEVLARGEGARGYPPSFGTPAFREAAARWMDRRFGVTVDPEHLAACVGSKEFVASTAGYLHLRTPERDTVLYPQTSYPTYAMGAQLAGLRAVAVPLADGRLDLASVSAADAARALLLWTNSPSNPTGRLDDLGAAAAWGRERGVPVLSDECYCEYTWVGAPRTILEHGTEGVLAVHSISKRSNLAGVRAGFYAGDAALVSYLRAVRQHAGLMVPAPVQAAAAAAYGDDEHVNLQRERYATRLEMLRAALQDGGYDAVTPEGTFYLWVSGAGQSDWELAEDLARRAGVVVSPGELYDDPTRSHVRIAVVPPTKSIELVVERLAHAAVRTP